MAGFCNAMPGLWAPKFAKCEANSPKVSGHYREYFRFPETVEKAGTTGERESKEGI
jgi:hypothetical protein